MPRRPMIDRSASFKVEQIDIARRMVAEQLIRVAEVSIESIATQIMH